MQAINRIQKRLQDPKMNFRDAADDILGLKEIMRTRGEIVLCGRHAGRDEKV